jgi:hypothetical protein
MNAKEDEPRRYGTLIRGATGELWFLLDNSEEAIPVKDKIRSAADLERLNELLPPQGPEVPLYTVGLPKDVNEMLEEAFGPLFWCIGLLTARRLNP